MLILWAGIQNNKLIKVYVIIISYGDEASMHMASIIKLGKLCVPLHVAICHHFILYSCHYNNNHVA